jgi:hypothetical protein
MRGKYHNPAHFLLVRAQRALLRAAIRPLVQWKPMGSPEPGYSVLIGCTARLWRMLGANLRMLARQDLKDMREIIVVFDRPCRGLMGRVEPHFRRAFPDLPMRFTYYSPAQYALCATLRWAWVYAWASWSMAIAATKTRFALLHDFDAMPLREDILRERHERIARGGVQYLGMQHYKANGVIPEDNLVTTFEMMFDAAFVRERFRPIDLFNHVTMHRGRTVDFDTFLHAQASGGRTEVLPVAEEDMVHPTQMICQFTELMHGRSLAPTRSRLFFIPYLLHLADEGDGTMRDMTASLALNGAGVPFFGRTLNASVLEMAHVEWLAKQAGRLEAALHGGEREQVRAYFDALRRCAGAANPSQASTTISVGAAAQAM